MDRCIAFAKSIHAYQLQPVILTPFPGTSVYEQFCQEHHMLPEILQHTDTKPTI